MNYHLKIYTGEDGLSNPLGLKKNGDHGENKKSNLILSCPNILKFASVKALNSISQRLKPQTLKGSITVSMSLKSFNRLGFSLLRKERKQKREKKTSTPFTHHSSSITLISGRGILTSNGFPCVFLASVSPLPMCEGQVSILDHVLQRKHKQCQRTSGSVQIKLYF